MSAQRIAACLRGGTTFKRSALGLIFSVAGVMFLGSASVGSASVQTPIIHVLSNRADLISGRDALVSIDVPPRVNSGRLHARLSGVADPNVRLFAARFLGL